MEYRPASLVLFAIALTLGAALILTLQQLSGKDHTSTQISGGLGFTQTERMIEAPADAARPALHMADHRLAHSPNTQQRWSF